jgi:NhaA family Na+:H+ antiporter
VMLNRFTRLRALTPYLLAGSALWWLMLRSGIHATLAGVLLAAAIPFERGDRVSPAVRLERWLAAPVSLLVLPLFALANAGVTVDLQHLAELANSNTLGIVGGLALGKPLGIGLACVMAIRFFRLELPASLGVRELARAAGRHRFHDVDVHCDPGLRRCTGTA